MTIPKAWVQHYDMEGTAAVDWHPQSEGLTAFAKSKGIDTTRYRPISISFQIIEPRDFTIYAVDMTEIGELPNTILSYAQNHEGHIPVVKYGFESNLDEIKPYLKMSDIMLHDLPTGVTGFKLIREEHLG